MSVRIGVIGTGFGARVVGPVFAATPGCEVADVVSSRDDAGVAALCDRADLDLVSVHSPPFLHMAHVRRALANGHAVICDKPFGVGASQSEALLAAAEAAECLHLINFEFRYDPMREQLRTLIADGAVGEVEHVSWTHISAGSRVPLRPHGWLFDRGQGGGWIGAWGSHAIDALRFSFGEVVTARADCHTTITERPGRDGQPQTCDAEDGFTAVLGLEGGASVSIDSTFAATASVAPRMIVSGSHGTLECIADARIVVRGADGGRDEYSGRSQTEIRIEPMQRFATVVRDAVEAGVAPSGSPTFADGLAAARVMDQLRG